jgi:hypothetical protein
VRTYFGDDRIDPATYRQAMTDDLSPDPGDRVHAAAAIHGNADVVLTRNLKHLRTAPVLAAGIDVITSDEFLCALLDDHPEAVIESFTRAAGGRKDPPTTPTKLAQHIAAAGAPEFAERLQALLAR